RRASRRGPPGRGESLITEWLGGQDGAPLPGGERDTAAWGCHHECSSSPASGRAARACGGHVVRAESLCRWGIPIPDRIDMPPLDLRGRTVGWLGAPLARAAP